MCGEKYMVDIEAITVHENDDGSLEKVLSGVCASCGQQYFKRIPKPIEIE